MKTLTGINIDRFAIAQLVIACKLYVNNGMKMTRGPAPTTTAKKFFGLKGSGQKILDQLLEIKKKIDEEDVWPDTYVFRNALLKGITGKQYNEEVARLAALPDPKEK